MLRDPHPHGEFLTGFNAGLLKCAGLWLFWCSCQQTSACVCESKLLRSQSSEKRLIWCLCVCLLVCARSEKINESLWRHCIDDTTLIKVNESLRTATVCWINSEQMLSENTKTDASWQPEHWPEVREVKGQVMLWTHRYDFSISIWLDIRIMTCEWMNETLSVCPVMEKAEAELHQSSGSRSVCYWGWWVCNSVCESQTDTAVH